MNVQSDLSTKMSLDAERDLLEGYKGVTRAMKGVMRAMGFWILDLDEKDIVEVTIKTQGKAFCLSPKQLQKLVLENCEPTNKTKEK